MEDTRRQLTIRAVIAGMLLGGFMSLSNLYTALKLGWSFGVSITSGILAYGIFMLLLKVGLVRRSFGVLENNAMQSVASAAGYMTGGGTVAAIPAMMMITGEPMPALQMFAWITSIALLGVVMAIPMKQQMINVEQLRFPSGVAAAETLQALHAENAQSVEKARLLGWSGAVGAVVAFLRDAKPAWLPWHLPEKLPIPGLTMKGRPLLDYTIGVEGSLIMVGAGAIMGWRSAWSLLVGMFVNYVVLAPMLYERGVLDQAAAAASYDKLGECVDTALGFKNIVYWSVWFGSAMILTSGLLAFAFQWRTVAAAIRSVGAAARTGDGPEVEGIREVPMTWFVAGMLALSPVVILLEWLFFDSHPLLGLLSVVMGFFIAIVACRATGETDTTPTGSLGKITQITFGVLDPGNMTTNLMTANVTGGVGLHAADLLTDLKSGYLLKADPRQQFWGQFFGVLAGSLFVVPAYRILVPTADVLGTEQWPAQGALTWKSVAELMAKGIGTMHPSAQVALMVGAALGIVLVLLEKGFPRAKPYIPSATGLGLAFTAPAWNTISMFVGALIALVLERRKKELADRALVPVSSGLIAGESLMAVAIAAWSMRELFANPTLTAWGKPLLGGVAALLVGWILVRARARRAPGV
jgi:OPT family oligopeptide transporter